MAMTDNLNAILASQKQLISDLEHEIQILSNSNLTKENTLLKKELKELKKEYETTSFKLKNTMDENTGLKNALYAQIYNEKLSILNLSAQKLDIYFGKSQDNGLNKLTQFENQVKNRIDAMFFALEQSHVNTDDEIYERLSELGDLLNKKITKARMEYAKTTGAFSESEKEEFQMLKNEQISEEQVRKAAKKNNIEAFIGQNLINKIGIFLIVIGVIAASQFTYFQLPNEQKGIMMFVLGGAMLGVGEFLNRKKPSIFSLGITAGGVAVLYVTISVSYFVLKILTMYPALIICVLVTAVSFLLSIRYQSKTVCAFALIGGYLPIFSISTDNLAMVYGAMVYFLILNVFALGVSYHKKWTLCSYIGLVLNCAATIYITFGMLHNIGSKDYVEQFILITYIVIAFLIYTFIPILGTYRTFKQFSKADVILLAINTFISSIILYVVFYDFDWEKWTGLLAILFAVTYLLLGRFIDTKFKNEKSATALFYLTGFAFVVLVIPFQFGKTWWSLGWLAEGVGLTTYGILRKEKSFKKYGFIINTLCFIAFLWVDVFLGFRDLFAYKYLSMTLGSLIILGAYIYQNEQFGTFQKVYKYGTIINLWFYSIYISIKANDLLHRFTKPYPAFNDYLVAVMLLILTLLIAYGCFRIKRIADLGTKVIGSVLYVIIAIGIISLNGIHLWGYQEVPLATQLLGTFVLILANLLAVFAVKDLMKYLVMEKKIKVEWYPLAVSAYFVLLLTENLTLQYQLDFSNMFITIIYAVTALLWIIFGFIKRYSFIRSFGLGLAILSVAKLFLLDLSYLTEGKRIIAYFALGISLVAISFVYQIFSRRLELQEGALRDD